MPEGFGQLAVVLPAGVHDFESEGGVSAVGVQGEGVRGEDEIAARGGLLEPGHDGGDHTAADGAALVLGGYMHRPDVEAGLILQVYRNAADGNAVLAGDEVAMLGAATAEGEAGGGAPGAA